MPIRINLKELFSSDSQEITIDKINFNLNKILELGVGTPGPIGPKGPKGSAGPKGLTGEKGDRGNNWFIGSGSPVSQSFTGLNNLDFYVDTVTGAIWQYSGGTWSQLVDFSSIVSAYLSSLGALFERGFGIGSSIDNKFLRFVNRGNTLSDVNNDVIGGTSNNDILFLDNFNENAGIITVANFPADPDEFYTSLQKIYVDNSTGVPGRFHLDFGTIYPNLNPPFDLLFTDIKHNFKLSQYVEGVAGGSTYPNTNSYVYTSKLNASISDLAPIGDIDFNSIFELKTAKYNNEAPFPNPPFKGNLITRVGAREGLGEFSNHIVADGISFSLQSYVSNLGIAYNYSSANSILNTKNLFMLDGNSSMDGILIDLRTYINSSADIYGDLNVGDRTSGDTSINVGANRNADGASQLDLIGDTVNTNYGLRVRRNSGVNGTSQILHLGTGLLEINAQGAADISLKTNNLDRLRIKANGRVGIGTASPASILHLVEAGGVIKLGDVNGSGNPILSLQDGVSTEFQLEADLSNLLFKTAGTERMRLTSGGRLGIGINPSYTLDVEGTGRFGPGNVTLGIRTPGVMIKGGQSIANGSGNHNGLLMSSDTTLLTILNNDVMMTHFLDTTSPTTSYNFSNRQFRLSNGSESSPGLVFSSSPTTGFYRPANNQIGISISGSRKITILDVATVFGNNVTLGNALISHSVSSSSTPSYSFKGNEQSGLYLDLSTNDVGLSRLGSSKLILDGNNNHTSIFSPSPILPGLSSSDLFRSGETNTTGILISGVNCNYYMIWSRVGRVVTVHFFIQFASDVNFENTSTQFDLPLGPGSSECFGFANLVTSGAVFKPGKVRYVPSTSTTKWRIEDAFNGSTLTAAEASGSFSYIV